MESLLYNVHLSVSWKARKFFNVSRRGQGSSFWVRTSRDFIFCFKIRSRTLIDIVGGLLALMSYLGLLFSNNVDKCYKNMG